MRPHNVRFRRGNKDKAECAASECSLVCSDYWKAGWGRIQVVPSVQVRIGNQTHENEGNIADSGSLLMNVRKLYRRIRS